ncbi:unnamed protein product [Hymenolepis diminuta]|uniref:Chromo domain-containing protein n=1 Tax=Hymenolepis diminuta TaxID=6216 RepID=A0A0R3SA09_HYMDI|nr:unnamed protein product [Hymenolepis diminuta]
MDNHSYSGYNTSGSSFLQELTVEDGSKSAYAGGQPPQQLPYPAYQVPNSTNYPTVSDVPPSSYYNGQYNADSYYYNHPSYPQRGKYPESYPAGQTMPSQQSVSGQSSMNPSWSDNQQLPQYQSNPYTPQSTFHSGGNGSSRIPAPNFAPGHISSASGSSQQQQQSSYQTSSYQTSSGLYCHAEAGYSGVPQQSHSMSVNGEPLMNPYSQEPRIPPLHPSTNIPYQQLPKPPKPLPKPVINQAVPPYSSPPDIQESTAALQHFVNTKCPHSSSSNELPLQKPSPPSLPMPEDRSCLAGIIQSKPISSAIPDVPVIEAIEPGPLHVKSLEMSNQPNLQQTSPNLPFAAPAFSPNFDQAQSETSPLPPNLKSPHPLQSSLPTSTPTDNQAPPILPKEEIEGVKEQSMDQSEYIPALELEKSDLEIGKAPQKKQRGRKRKLERGEEIADTGESPSKPRKKRSEGKRKSGNGDQPIKRARRKTIQPKSDEAEDKQNESEAIEEEEIEASTSAEIPAELPLLDEDEDTMAASVAAPTDEESVAATTTTTEEITSEIVLKPPRPPPRVRAPKPKKKKTLKFLMKKKRRCGYYGEESDGTESEDDSPAEKPAKRGAQKSSSSLSLHTQYAEDSPLDGSSRRSGRRAADRKKYTIESADFGLSDDTEDSDESDNDIAENSRKPSDADFVEVKVVEKILGRRMSTRPVKKSTPPKSSIKVESTSSEKPEEKPIPVRKSNDTEALKESFDSQEAFSQEKKENERKEQEEEEEQIEEFYVKYKGFSYMHCEWKALDEIEDPRFGTKLKKFLAKNGGNDSQPDEDEGTTVLFNPDYVEVERVLDIRIYDKTTGEIVTDEVLNPDGTIKRQPRSQKKTNKKRGRPPKSATKEEDTEDDITNTPETVESDAQEEEDEQPTTVTYYLVKWRSLPYEHCTWELAEDVDPTKVKEYMRIRNPPKNSPVIRDSNHRIIRPDPSEWRSITIDEVYRNDNRLREYQVEGVNWLSYCWYNKRNCILADEMGLGKTVQSIAFLLEVLKAGVNGPFLIIVPLSTVGNWQREFENWSDLNAIVYHGSSVSRKMIQDYELFYFKKKPSGSSSSLSTLSSALYRHDVYKFNAIITTFEVLMSDIEFFSKMHWAVAIIDEAHRLKNKKCKLGEGLRYLDFDHRVLLTGTPLQNNVEELFGLLNFLDPQRFGCATTFLTEFGELKTEEQVEDLKKLLKPMMLRRLKEDVEKSLAPKEETIIEVELTNLQKKYYRAIMERNFNFLCKGTTGSNMPNLINVMMELRKCCNHPFLIKGAEEAILAEQRSQAEEDPSKPYNEEQQMFNAMLNASGKLVLIHKLLPKLKAGGHKVLVFSQMIRVLDILEDYLVYQGFSYERIDGRIHGLLRQEAIDRFCNDKEKFIFLLCTKAGGLGINLTAADVVIIYDSDWNPQNDLQAQARCHRIGQQKMVKVYRLITRNTYEREMFDRASLKLGLDKAVLQSTGANARQAQLSKKEVEELLKKGAYGALMDDDKAGDDFCEEDIDQILQSRSHVVQLEQGEKNSTFSKATFSISDTRNDIALDDPDFWQKWAKKAGVEQVGLEYEDLIMTTPRQRRQTNRYTAELNEQAANNSLSHAASSSRLQNGKNGAGSNGESSDGQSSSDESSGGDDDGGEGNGTGKSKHKKSKRNQRGDAENTNRVDLFRVEKCLFTWSWGRWAYALDNIPYKQIFTELELQRVARCILGYALKGPQVLNASGDGRIRAVIMEMVNSSDPNTLKTIPDIVQALKNSNNAVAGGGSSVIRRSRKPGGPRETDSPNAPSTPTTPNTNITFDVDTPKQEDPESVKREDDDYGIASDSFKRHLARAGGRLLVRVYILYFLHTEIVGLEQADRLCDGTLDHTAFSQLAESLPPLRALDADVPAEWWDSCCDKCLLLGVFKHGWEKYAAIRDDPAFCFYKRVYGQDAPNIPIPSTVGSLKTVETKTEQSEAGSTVKLEEKDNDEEKSLTNEVEKTLAEDSMKESSAKVMGEGDIELPQPLLLFPTAVDLNSRMRKLIAYFQRIRAQVEMEALHSLRTEFAPTITPQSYLDQRIKWSRREEADFYRVVSSFGVEQIMRSPHQSPTSLVSRARVFAGYNWTNFKGLANLSKKNDQAITEYYNAFFTMCHRVCKEPLPESTPLPVASQPTTTTFGSCAVNEVIPVAPISEERATRTLSRIKLLNRIRNVILTHEHLEERLALCQRSSDLPEWWVPGQHDRELLEAVARHGLSRTDLNILPDKKFSFSRVAALVRRQLMKNPSALQGVTPPMASLSAADSTAGGMNSTLSVSEVEARASLAAAASSAARAVAAELEAKIESVNVLQNEEASKQETENQEKKSEEGEHKPENGGSEEKVADSNPPTSPTLPDPQVTNSEQFKWSLQFATSLAVAWPKDRTIHNRLEMVCQCVETGHWPLPRRYLINSVDDMGRYHIAESTGAGSRDASPAPPSSPDISSTTNQKKTLTPSEAATLAALQAAGYTNIDQVLALQTAVAASAHQSDLSGSMRGRGGGRGSRGGRGRGRGSRGGTTGLNMYSREDFASAASLAKNSTSPLPTRGRGSRGGQVITSRGASGSTRGRKRKIEGMDASSAVLPPPDSPAWDVNVPLVSLTNGNLIHGDKAPKRRHLEAWLKANPEYMPYSVEQEDQIIFKRVAQSRGQNTSAMEALAYRHYMSTMLSKVVNYTASSTQRPTPSTSTATSDAAAEQQKQMMNLIAASMYSGNPAYATLLASMMGYAQTGTQQQQTQQQQKNVEADRPSSSNDPVQSSATTASSSDPATLVSAVAGSSTAQMSTENIQSTLSAYQQVASLLSYMYNPSLYAAQQLGASAASANPTSAASSLQAQMTGLLSMFAMRSQQQTQQQIATSETPTITQETPAPAHSPRPSSSRQDPQEAPEEMDAAAPVNMETAPSTSQPEEASAEDSTGVASENTVCDSDVLDLSKPE